MTLQEEMEVIRKQHKSMTARRQALMELGLSEKDAFVIAKKWRDHPNQVAKCVVDKLTDTFGIELELVNADRSRIIEEFEKRGLPLQYEKYNHDSNLDYWKFTTDHSIKGKKPIECVSPILQGEEGVKALRKACEALNAAGVKVNKSTGLHVHLGARELTDMQFINVFHNYKMLETAIDQWMPEDRRGNKSFWARSFADHSFENMHERGDVIGELAKGLNGCFKFIRYHKVNPEAFSRHRTLEFRQHGGTTCFAEIEKWLKFCKGLIEFSKLERIPCPINRVEDIPFRM